MFLPSPLTHHSLLWKPLPAKRTANRTGASLAGAAALGSSPQTLSDSIHGRAIVTPTPRRKVLRVNLCMFILDRYLTFLTALFFGSKIPAPNLLELPAA